MNSADNNPFAILTFLAAPAILTNASTIITLSTSNRFGLAIDRAKAILSEMRRNEANLAPQAAIQAEHLKLAERRVLLLVRALTVFYVSVASLSAATLVFLVGAVLFVAQNAFWQVALIVALLAGTVGVGGVAIGCGILLGETRMAYSLLTQEADVRNRHPQAIQVVQSLDARKGEE